MSRPDEAIEAFCRIAVTCPTGEEVDINMILSERRSAPAMDRRQ